MLKYFFLIITLLISFQNLMSFEQRDYFYNTEYPNRDTINMGVFAPGDSAIIYYKLNNPTTDILRMEGDDPWYIYGKLASESGEGTWAEFTSDYNGSIELDPENNHTFYIKYSADKELLKYPLGTKYLRMIMGFTKKGDPKPETYKDLIVSDTFYVKASKSEKDIDQYENYYNFDSVLVNPSHTISEIHKVKNLKETEDKITKESIRLLTPLQGANEFRIEESFVNQNIPPKQTVEWKISYTPHNIGQDSMMLDLINDSDTLSALFKGTGVEQKLDIIYSDVPIIEDINSIADTIDIGDIRVDQFKEIEIRLKNIGNYPIGIKNQIISNIDSKSTDHNLIERIDESRHFHNEDEATLRFNFRPTEVGVFYSKLEIESDIGERGIKGVNSFNANPHFIIRGRGVDPVFTIHVDTVDFGNVVLNVKECSKRDTIIRIKNTGNFPLAIENIEITVAGTPFAFSDLTPNPIPPMEEGEIIFSYTPNKENESSYNVFTFKTNESEDNRFHYFYVFGNSIKPDSTTISAPDIRSKPGTILSIPIKVDEDKIQFAKIFTDTINFDPTLLSVLSVNTVNTAAEGALINTNFDNDKGFIAIELEMPGNNYFFPKEILFNLSFNTYLGNSISNPISFTNPKLGDDNCPQIMRVGIDNGSFTLDSICGLQYLAHDRENNRFSIINVSPNPSFDDAKISFEMAFKTQVEISIYDIYGQKIKELLNNELPKGTYEQSFDCSQFSAGKYYIIMQSGIFKEVKQIAVIK